MRGFKREVQYVRKPNDFYPTPDAVTETVIPWLPGHVESIWEPCAGNGAMSDVFAKSFDVWASDIAPLAPQVEACDMLAIESCVDDAIITNPPYKRPLCETIVRHACKLMQPRGGLVAMLLPIAWDSAKTRQDLFRDSRGFDTKVVLTSRIIWFREEATGKPKAAPTESHAWYIWDYGTRCRGYPRIVYQGLEQ